MEPSGRVAQRSRIGCVGRFGLWWSQGAHWVGQSLLTRGRDSTTRTAVDLSPAGENAASDGLCDSIGEVAQVNLAACSRRPAHLKPAARVAVAFPSPVHSDLTNVRFTRTKLAGITRQKRLSEYPVSDTIPISVRRKVVVFASATVGSAKTRCGLSLGAEALDCENAFDRGNELMASRKLPKDEVFERLFDVHFGWVQRWFVSVGFTASVSEDLAQETFARVYTGLDGFRGESSVGTWIKTIASRLALNHRRGLRAQKRKALELSLDDEDLLNAPLEVDANDPLDLVLQREKLEFLERAIDDLPPQRRRCLILRAKGHKYKEIAILLGITIEAVKSQLNQARNELRPRLSEHFSGIHQDAGDDL